MASNARGLRRITLHTRTITRDPAYGSDVETWTPLRRCWATIRTKLTESRGGDGETVQTSALQVTKTTVRIGYYADVNETMRLTLPDGRLMRITSVAEVGRRESLDIACEEWHHDG